MFNITEIDSCVSTASGQAALTVLAAARSHSGSDSRLRLSFITLVPLRYVQGCHSLPLSLIPYGQKKKNRYFTPTGIDSRRLDACSVIAALTCHRHVIHSRSLRFPTDKKEKPLFYPYGNRFSQARRLLGHRGSDMPPACHSLPLSSIPYGQKRKTAILPLRESILAGSTPARSSRL